MHHLSWLSLLESEAFFGAGSQHVPVPLSRLPAARVVWINQWAMHDDPMFEVCGGTAESYAAHILQSCAYAVAEPEVRDGTITGFADRYGGQGIGHNGGSGRAVVLNGYHVKGVGRTPLIGVQTNASHASGGAYLEECVRETIFSELVAAEFPGGSVPTLAIIDTGRVQKWNTPDGVLVERRCLLVRPALLRPAHFERAPKYLSGYAKEGYLDDLRVRRAFDRAASMWTADGVYNAFRAFGVAWAEQLAYAFVHRLPHGGDTTSNIALDGRLLDFGAMTAVPSLGRISTIVNSLPTGEAWRELTRTLRLQSMFLARHVVPHAASNESVQSMVTLALQQYEHTILREMLRLAGLSRKQAEQLLAGDDVQKLSILLGRMLTHYRREHLAVFNGMPMPVPRVPFDLGQLWSAAPPIHLRPLRAFLEAKLQGERGCLEGSTVHTLVAKRCVLRTQARDTLYRDTIKSSLFTTLECELIDAELNQVSLDRLIYETVCQGRRDSQIEPDEAIPIGFACHANASYALFQDQITRTLFAIQERKAGANSQTERTSLPRIPLVSVTKERVIFATPDVPLFEGAVALVRSTYH